MIDVNELRKGVTFEVDDQIFRVLEYTHNKPGRGNATIRCKLRNLKTGATIERTFQSGDRVQDIRLDHHQGGYTLGRLSDPSLRASATPRRGPQPMGVPG